MSLFPFDAVVGQDDAKLALRLAAADPRIGGVLLRGEKGSAKTTLARGLAGLLGDVPFVDLPLGATEDRVVGTLDTRAALAGGDIRFEPGLLAQANGGILYVDEINLLADHLVDVLLDVAVSGINTVERDGVSHRHDARFVLVGSMNPEEGELRPQLLDRFGFCVEVTAPRDVDDRAEAVRRRLAFDAETAPSADGTSDASDAPADEHRSAWTPQYARQVEGRPSPAVPDELLVAASTLAVEVGAEGLRADLTLVRAAVAHARLVGRDDVIPADLRRVAPLVLAHRSRRGPFDPPVVPPEELDDAVDDVLGPDDTPEDTDDTPDTDAATDSRHADDSDATPRDDHDPTDHEPTDHEPADHQPAADEPADGEPGDSTPTGRAWVAVPAVRRPPPVLGRVAPADRGRAVGHRAAGPSDPIAVVPTIRSVAARRSADPSAAVDDADLRTAVRAQTRSTTIVLCVDLSGSMGAPARAEAAAGTVLGLLADAYERRHHVGLVTFRGTEATTVLSPTRSIEVARNRLDDLETGGATPLAAGLHEALAVATRAVGVTTGVRHVAARDGLIVVLTDGRATGAGGFDAALDAAAAIARSDIDALVLDCEDGDRPLGLAPRLAEAMGARYLAVSELAPQTLTRAVASMSQGSR